MSSIHHSCANTNLKQFVIMVFIFTAVIKFIFRVMSIHDFSSEKVAEQMTLLDLELFQKIEVSSSPQVERHFFILLIVFA